MHKRAHDIIVGVLVLAAIVLAMTSTYWLPYVSHMSHLFKDKVTIGLIATVVVLLTLYDCKLGVAFAFVVAIIAINLSEERFESFKVNSTTTTKHEQHSLPNTKKMSATVENFQNIENNEQGASVIEEKIEKQMTLPKSCPVTDFNTYSKGKDYHGYDVAGCRYDLENRTQNSTVYGPPLSWCATYNKSGALPVPFYPLNG